ncbi:hypothetical protein [Methylorubrum extorquens]
MSTRKPARARAVPQSFGVTIEDLGGGRVLISASSDDEQLAVHARALKRCDRAYRVEGGDWLKSKTAKRAASIPFSAGEGKRLKPSEARERTLLAVKAARDAMHLAFGRKQAFEEALIQLIAARDELRVLAEGETDTLSISVAAHKALIYTTTMRRVPIRLAGSLGPADLDRDIALLEAVMRDGSCLGDWLARAARITGRGRGSVYEIDAFVHALVIFWERATGELPTRNVTQTIGTDRRFCDFYHLLSDACADVGILYEGSAAWRVRPVIRQLEADRKAARQARAQQNRMERASLNPEERAERRRQKKADSETRRRQKKRMDKTLGASPLSSSSD